MRGLSDNQRCSVARQRIESDDGAGAGGAPVRMQPAGGRGAASGAAHQAADHRARQPPRRPLHRQRLGAGALTCARLHEADESSSMPIGGECEVTLRIGSVHVQACHGLTAIHDSQESAGIGEGG